MPLFIEGWDSRVRELQTLNSLGLDFGEAHLVSCIFSECIPKLCHGKWDITYCVERRSIAGAPWGAYLTDGERAGLRRGGINSGTMAIATRCYQAVMAEWERIHQGPCSPGGIFLEQGAWNRLILDTRLRTRSFERDAIMFPMNEEVDFRVYRDATLLHCLGDNLRAKVQFTFGLYMGAFFFDEAGTLLNLLDM